MNEINKQLRGRTFGYISAALGLVAGLAWNEAISAMIEAIFPLSKDTVWVKFLYAIIVTVAVVILVKYLDRMFNRPEPGK
jgi:energy-converting hydrogenase Eha subunit A